MQPHAHMELDQQLCFAVYACSREITKLYRPLLEPLGLTYTQYVTMLALWESGKMKVKELGQALYLDSGTLTPLLKKLEASGVVTRVRDSRDERNVFIEVTEAGWELREKASQVPLQIFCNSGIGVEEAQELHLQLVSILRKLHNATPEES